MAKLTDSRINYIKANINSFEPLTYINATKGDATEVKTPTREFVFNIINSCRFFRKFGRESATIRSKHNGGDSLIMIEIFSQSPDKKIWESSTIYLKTDEVHCRNLGI